MSILIPKGLYGTTASTRHWWTDIAQTAWRNRGWRGALERLDLIPADLKPGPIVLWNYDHRVATTNEPVLWSTQEDCWQLNWILESLPADYDDLLREPELHFHLVLDAMSFPWYCLALLEGDPRFLPFLYENYQVNQASDEVHQHVTRPFLRSFLRWLPQMVSLDGRIARASGQRGVEVVGVREQFGVFLDLAHYCGAIGDDDWWSLVGYPLDVLAARMASVYESLGTGQNEST